MSHCCGRKAADQQLELTVQETSPGVVVNVDDLRAELFRIADTLEEAYAANFGDGKIRQARIVFGDDAWDIPRFHKAVHTVVADLLSTVLEADIEKDERSLLELSSTAPTTASTVNIEDLIMLLRGIWKSVPQLNTALNAIMLAQLWTPLANRVAAIKTAREIG